MSASQAERRRFESGHPLEKTHSFKPFFKIRFSTFLSWTINQDDLYWNLL